MVQSGEDVVGIGAEGGCNGGGQRLDAVFLYRRHYADKRQSDTETVDKSKLNIQCAIMLSKHSVTIVTIKGKKEYYDDLGNGKEELLLL